MLLFLRKIKYLFSLFFLKNNEGGPEIDYTQRVEVKYKKKKELSGLDKIEKNDFVKLLQRENNPRLLRDIIDKRTERR